MIDAALQVKNKLLAKHILKGRVPFCASKCLFAMQVDASVCIFCVCVAYQLFLFVKSLLTQGNVNVIDGWKKWCADEKESIEKTIGLEKHFPVEESEKTCGNDGQNYCH